MRHRELHKTMACVPFLGLIKTSYHRWVNIMTSSGASFSALPRTPTLSPPMLLGMSKLLTCNAISFDKSSSYVFSCVSFSC